MQEFLTVAFLQFLVLISPGPDFALVLKNAILYPRRIALYTALGVAIGICVHTAYCIFGLAVVIASSEKLFNLIKYVGASYLIYIGIKSLLAKDVHMENKFQQSQNQLTVLPAIRQGFLCNALNPKASLFFLGLFTLVVKPSTPIWVQILYSIEMMTVTFVWFAFVVFIMQHPVVQIKIERVQHYVTKILGVVLILFGARLLFLTHA